MDGEDLNPLLYTANIKDLNKGGNTDLDYYLEQYRIYLHIFNANSDRSHKSNEFFLGLNAAIIGILGYAEIKSLPNENIFFLLVPFIGISISISWYRIICTYRDLNKAKFKVIHAIEEKLPMALFKTEWHILTDGGDERKHSSFSKIEKNIPLTFIALYVLILAVNIPWEIVFGFLK